MTNEFLAGEQAERARSVKWLADRAASYESLAVRQRTIGEPTAAINAAYARAFRHALSFLEADDEVNSPPPATTDA
jgi:hypothetical protein